MTWVNMKRFFIYILVLSAVFLTAGAESFAAARKVPVIAVISDSGHRNGTTYLVCGAASDIIAADIINRLNQTGRIKAPLLGENMSKITQKNIPLYYMTFFNDYKYNYNIDFVNLKRVTRYLNADYILMVTSGLDIQSQLFKETWWNKWGISSSEPITPTYRLTTMLTLIDKKTYSIVWQDLYQRDIKAKNMDLGVTQFSPNYPQLAKIKKYSNTMSEYVVNIVDRTVNPWIVPPEEPKSVEMRSRFVNEGTKIYYPAVNGEVVKQNFNEFKTDTQNKWDKYQKERQQKKHIENVRRLEQKRREQEIKQLELKNKQLQQEKNIVPINNKKKKEEPRLFDSIRNNIDDVTNTLPPVTEEEKALPSAQPTEQKLENQEPELLKPVMQLPAKQETQKVQPAVNKQAPANKPAAKQQNSGQKTLPVKNTDKQKNLQQKTPQKHVPYYDWNLENIYLQKIGRLSNLNYSD